MSIRITCIKKAGGNHENPYVAISLLGWIEDVTNKTGTTERVEMHNWIVQGGYAYVKNVQGVSARLIAETSPRGTKYVKTVADQTITDNLLQLPEC